MKKLAAILLLFIFFSYSGINIYAYSAYDIAYNVEWVQQEEGYYCGPATAKSIINDAGLSQDDLAEPEY